MEKFNKQLLGYDQKEVNQFIDQVIREVSHIRESLTTKEREIEELKRAIEHYQSVENTLNKALIAASETSDQIKKMAMDEARIVIEEARRNASRVMNDAYLRVNKIDQERERLRQSTVALKHKLKVALEAQLDMVNDLEMIDIENRG